jgi:hypothetical protein
VLFRATTLRRLGAALFLVAAAFASAAAAPDHHAQLRFWLDTAEDRAFFESEAQHLDIVHARPGEFVDILVPQSAQAAFMARGSRVELIHADVETFYAERLGTRADYGLYHTYSESVAWMDTLRDLYPQVISARWSIGAGHLGNQIWCARLSDNPDSDEDGEPEVLFDGAVHARELMAAEMPMMLAEYLCEQYAVGDPEIVALLDQNEVYILPITNPDGFLYNEQTNPNGGGMWRKNRRDNGASYGVDVNRNYPYEWGCDWGSSGVPSDETYRGPSAGSEPETQALMAFINAQDFVVRQSYHTYGELTLYPWGYTTAATPDEDTFREMAAAMVQYNGYTPGQPGEVLYDVCGGSFDWDYGAQAEHSKLFGFTNEMGNSGDGFWPVDARRQPIFDENLWPALYLIQVAGSLRGVTWTHSPLPFTATGGSFLVVGVPQGYEGAAIDPGSVVLRYRVGGGSFTALAMAPTGQPGQYGATIPGQAEGSAIEYYLSADDVMGNHGTSPRNAPDALYYFEVGASFAHDMEADRGWSVGDAADGATSGLWVRVDPVGTAAQPEDDHSPVGAQCWVTGQHLAGQTIGYNDVDGGATTLFSPVYDLTGAESAGFSYWRWYSNDKGSAPGLDYWQVFISNDAGQSWTAVENTLLSSNAWEGHSFDLATFFPVAGEVQLKFVASDTGSGSIVEGAVDDFAIAGVFDTTGVDESPAALRVSLSQAFPNPFNPMTTVRFTIAKAGPASLGVYDAQGRLLRSLLVGQLEAGEQAVSWNGRDALGRPVASGIYFIRLHTDGQELTRKIVLAK